MVGVDTDAQIVPDHNARVIGKRGAMVGAKHVDPVGQVLSEIQALSVVLDVVILESQRGCIAFA
ncbi:hypothetical protein D5301_15275 [Stenotrophomonas sp. MH181796]|nr:hypothetical protein [Stenotrophomonas sp. MH181796]PZP77613.1 MAG: hypothetical protein DI592_16855 [Stenotrophomonas maltophilia]